MDLYGSSLLTKDEYLRLLLPLGDVIGAINYVSNADDGVYNLSNIAFESFILFIVSLSLCNEISPNYLYIFLSFFKQLMKSLTGILMTWAVFE